MGTSRNQSERRGTTPTRSRGGTSRLPSFATGMTRASVTCCPRPGISPTASQSPSGLCRVSLDHRLRGGAEKHAPLTGDITPGEGATPVTLGSGADNVNVPPVTGYTVTGGSACLRRF